MPSVAITPGRMQILARALDRAVASAIVPRLRIDELRSSFVATDEQGRSWTIDLESHRWGRLHGERWVVEDPPQQLFMDTELRASLEALEAMAARAIMTGADALQAPRTSWFRAPGPPAEASIPSQESVTAPQPPLDRKQAPFEEPVSSESRSSRASVSGTSEPAMLTVRPFRNSSMVGEPAPSVALGVTSKAATPVEKTAPSRPAIPEAHLRFAGPGFAPVSDDLATPALAVMAAPDGTPASDRMPLAARLPARVPPRDASPKHERGVPTSIAPRLTSLRPEAPDDRAHVVLCGVLAVLFLALASWKGDGRGYAAALLFGLLTVALLVLNLARSRQD